MRANSTGILVGASGRVGTLLRAVWALAPPDALSVTCQWRQARDGRDGLVWSPLEGPGALKAWAGRHGPPDTIMMLAGVTPSTQGALDTNARLAVACLEAARATGCGRVLIASSSVVYGPGHGAPIPEDAPYAPVSPYGVAKRDMERACRPFRDAGLDVCCLRIGNVLGADALMLNAATGQPLVIDRFRDGSGPIRSFLGPLTLGRILERLCTCPGPLPEALNVGAPHPVAMETLAEAAGLDWQWRDAPETALHDVTLDCTRLAGFYTFSDAESRPEEMLAQLARIDDLP